MKTAILALNPRSQRLAGRIGRFLGAEHATLFPPSPEPLSRWLPRHWRDFAAWVFVLPLGVVVRVITPLLEDKHTDPAVVTVDEGGRYFISTLSGHEGGANQLAQKLAAALGGEAVITTATEAGKRLVVGVGCRRGVSAGQIISALKQGLALIGRSLDEVRVLASIDLKNDEAGLLEAARELGVAINFIPKQWLKELPLDYQPSPLVEEKLGIGGVAEPCALLGGKRTQIILPKIKTEQVTIAIAEEGFPW